MPPPPGVMTTSRSPGGTIWVPLPLSFWPDLIATKPAAPALPPSRPRGGWSMRSKAASRSNGSSMPLSISMIWPEPAARAAGAARTRAQLLAPEDQRRLASAISTGVPRTPLG